MADRSHVGVATVRRAEAVDGPVPVTPANAEAIARALEDAGIELINGDAPGVRLKPRRKA